MEKVFSLVGQRVVVVGGSSGIGFAVAQCVVELGGEVVIASSSGAKVEAALARLPGASGGVADVRDPASLAAFFDGVAPFQHLVLTAGTLHPQMFAATDDIDFGFAREAFEFRVLGALDVVRCARKKLAADGSITLTSGMLVHRPMKGMPLLPAIAGATEHLVRGLAMDLAPQRVNGVCPGLTMTELVAGSARNFDAMTANLPLPRAATPAEAAQAYVYAMLNRYITGQVLPVDGGGLLI